MKYKIAVIDDSRLILNCYVRIILLIIPTVYINNY